MESTLHFLGQNLVVPLFLILGIGLIVGKIRIAGVELGGVTGVLFVGLVFGHYGFRLPPSSVNLGFILFIFCVGVQAGPSFVAAFKKDGLRYAALASITAVAALLIAVVLTRSFEFPMGMEAGALAGALTSTPTLVAARDAVSAGLTSTGDLTREQVLGNLSSSYAITYVFGLAGLVIFMGLMPKLFRLNLAEEAQAYESQAGSGGGGVERALRMTEMPTTQAYRVEKEDLIDRDWTDDELKIRAAAQRVKRDGDVFTPGYDYQPQIGDIVSVVATRKGHEFALKHIGPEVIDYDVVDRATSSRTIMVSNKNTVGRTLADMNFTSKYQSQVTGFIRSGIDMPGRPNLKLQLGDVLVVTGPPTQLDALADDVGYREDLMEQTDMVTFVFGIAIGVVIGLFSVSIGGIKIGLGTAGGSMLAGLVFGIIHSRKPTLARLPANARNILMELGLLLFMANVAVSAGAGIMDTIKSAGLTLAVCGMLITLSPAVVTFFVGRYGFKMNGAILLGAITGAMTSTPSLTQVTKLANSSVPTIGYVGTYAFANVLLAIAGTVIMML